ncbi:hypothetical protein CLV59_109161 [Chitinophaga dinghuensis]|uniref:Uncharacterized protein n=1 Tax=Chitinophaga dinghuensis TaxID=1539050 RepID=A0A327VQA4_9BACT|nr:hypothetical protein [Chitinophaga dinghuensis]RAJ75547.1 hypothetical protein CLV59_109161 [Chitinophaga dinghuensis]
MLTRLFVFLIILPSIASAQSVISGSRLLIKDSMCLNGNWVWQINNDSTLKDVSEKSISTDAALMKYIDHATTGGGNVSSLDIAKMMMNPNVLEVNVSFLATEWLIPFNLSFLSSDSIKSTISFSGSRPNDVFSVYGKPPFSLYAEVRNKNASSVMSLSLRISERSVVTFGGYGNYLLIKPGDSAFIVADKLRGKLSIEIGAPFQTTPETHLTYVNERIKNRSATQMLHMSMDGLNAKVLMPGQELSQRSLCLNPTGSYSYSIRAISFHTGSNGEYIAYMPNSAAVRCSVFRNGVLYATKDIPAYIDGSAYLPIVIDATWEDYEVILEDIQP